MLLKVGKYDFLCEPFHCDFSKQLFLGQLGNHMLNAADFHANERGMGINYLSPLHKTWVLSRLAIEMEAMPHAYDMFSVATWVESAMRNFTDRDFRVSDHDGNTLGYGKSIWALIDTDTRQPQDILKMHDGHIVNYIEPDKECKIGSLSRVNMSKEAQKCREFKVTYSDTDYNGHMNSIKYIERVLDIFPLEHYKTHFLRRIDIAYVAESYCGDTLRFYRETDADGGIMISVRKSNDNLQEEVEVVRCKVTFVKITEE